MGPDSSHLPAAASDIATHLQTPDIMFMQEIQDNSGATDDGTVDASETLSNLSAAIASQSSVSYNFTEVIPVNDQDGGEPGGNIRPAYLFNPKTVSLVPGIPVGGPLDVVKPVLGSDGQLTLKYAWYICSMYAHADSPTQLQPRAHRPDKLGMGLEPQADRRGVGDDVGRAVLHNQPARRGQGRRRLVDPGRPAPAAERRHRAAHRANPGHRSACTSIAV